MRARRLIMRSALSLTALLILSTSLSAQSNSPGNTKPAITSQGYPVSFTVKRSSGLTARNRAGYARSSGWRRSRPELRFAQHAGHCVSNRNGAWPLRGGRGDAHSKSATRGFGSLPPDAPSRFSRLVRVRDMDQRGRVCKLGRSDGDPLRGWHRVAPCQGLRMPG